MVNRICYERAVTRQNTHATKISILGQEPVRLYGLYCDTRFSTIYVVLAPKQFSLYSMYSIEYTSRFIESATSMRVLRKTNELSA
jgi:hypothetical protein